MKKTISSFLILVTAITLHAQGLINRIPDSSPFVITFNTQAFQGKVDLKEVSKMDFFHSIQDTGSASKMSNTFLTNLFCQPASCGVQNAPQTYLFRLDKDSVQGWCYLFGLTDANVFSTALTKAFTEQGHKAPAALTHSGYTSFQSGSVYASWTGSFALLMLRDANDPYQYSYYYEEQPVHSAAYMDSVQATEMARIQAMTDSIRAAEAAEEQKAKNPPKKTKTTKKVSEKKNNEHLTQEQLDAKEMAIANAIADSLAQAVTGNNVDGGYTSDYEKQELKRQEASKRRLNERCSRMMNKLMELDPARSMARIHSFNESLKEPCDIGMWMNWTQNAAFNPFGSRNYRGGKNNDSLNSMNTLLKDNYSTAFCTFDKGNVKLVNKAYMNPDMEKLIAGIYRKKGPSNLSKYIKGTNLMGYMAVSLDMEKVLKASGSILRKSYESYMGADAKYVNGMLDITSVFLNDDVMYNLLKGDLVLAVTDLRPFKISYLSYNYDDNFKRTETRQEKTEVLPEFLVMANTGKPAEVQKILDATEKMGGLKKEGDGIYLMELPKQNTFKIYVALANNILFVTNNEELVHGKLKSGYPKNEQMNAEEKKLLSDNSVAYYWNGSKTMDLIGKQPELKTGEKMTKNLNLLKDNIGTAQVTGVRKEGTAYVTNASLTFKDNSINSLFNIFKLINSFYLADR
ncbi:MAG: hypothetical protein ACHQRM_01215 [Bacteroidia bacterium]